MGDLPLLKSKLHAPRRRRGVVARARLGRRLHLDMLPTVTVVSAPAGFGKTTLVAESLEQERTAWVSLDRRDSDPATFWAYVIAAIDTVAAGAGGEALQALQSSPAALEAVATSLLNDLAGIEDDLVLVLDDYHLVESIEVHQSVLFLVEHAPAQLHVVVVSRADPPWPLGGLRARGDLLELRADDLRFRVDEAAAYLNDAMGLDLRPTDIDALEGRTEGWIAALQLAALSLQGRDDPTAFVAGFAGDDRFVVDYLVDEVLDRQPAELRTFLLETSILPRLSAPLCEAVTGNADAKAVLDAADRANLFLVPLDDKRQWFRFHHLFADVLRARLLDERGDVAELHRRASEWFEADGDHSEAIRHAMAAGEVERAAALIELAIPTLRQHRQDATQRELLEALPDHLFDDRPVLAMARVGARMVTGTTDGVSVLLDQVEAWLDPDASKDGMVVHDHAELRRLPAQAAMYRAGLALLGGDLAGTATHGERAAALSAPDDHLGRGAAAALVGLACWAAGDLRTAERQYSQAIAEFEAGGYLADILGCSLALADMQSGQGRLGDAEATLRAGLDLAAKHGPLRGTADMHIGLAEVHLERGELDQAADELRRSLEVGESLALAQHAYRWRVVDARLRAASGDVAGALELLREAETLYDTDYSPKVRPVAATTARIRLDAGDIEAAERWASNAGVAADDEPTYVREYEHLTLARLLLATGRQPQAAALLDRLLLAAEAGGRAGAVAEVRTLLALAKGGAPAAPPQPTGLVDELSARELDVLRLLRSELSGPEIAAELIVSLNTVRTHTKSIFSKLGVNNRRSAVRRADELGL